MKSEDDNMELEKEAPNLAAVSKRNAFEIPDGYFSEMTEQITNQVNAYELIGDENKFDTPTAYFENLSQQIQSSVFLDAIKVDGSTNNGFDVPAGYFSESEQRIRKNITAKPKKSNLIKLQFVRYAAAACILLTTSLGVYFNVKHNTSVDYQLSKIPATEIETYLHQHTDGSDLPMLLENIGDDIDFDFNESNLETK